MEEELHIIPKKKKWIVWGIFATSLGICCIFLGLIGGNPILIILGLIVSVLGILSLIFRRAVHIF
ncbi:MAG: hypothetical protein JSV49_09640 [Thermoplasmata archaeon]|nr:MAG: hypothetical protein JSV49_09640 [Thermoplasmata archaeon]